MIAIQPPLFPSLAPAYVLGRGRVYLNCPACGITYPRQSGRPRKAGLCPACVATLRAPLRLRALSSLALGRLLDGRANHRGCEAWLQAHAACGDFDPGRGAVVARVAWSVLRAGKLSRTDIEHARCAAAATVERAEALRSRR